MAKSYEELITDSALGFGWREDPFKRSIVADKAGDIDKVGGTDNLANSIYRRLNTPLDWYPEFPWFGSRLREMIGMGNTAENRAILETWVEESLLYERRIVDGTIKVSVEKSQADFRAVNISISCKVKAVPDASVFVYSFFLKTGNLIQVGTI